VPPDDTTYPMNTRFDLILTKTGADLPPGPRSCRSCE
jgi:hypothetical protein